MRRRNGLVEDEAIEAVDPSHEPEGIEGESTEIFPMRTVFTTQTFPMGQLVPMIERGTLGLPELQRPFVWTKIKVRDLFDSLYRGYPIGNFLFWKSPVGGARHIGISGHQTSPEIVILDGQQRLTSLYAVLTGKPVIDEHWQKQTIEIAFHPLKGEFAVTDAAIKGDVAWIANITELFQAYGDFAFINGYLQRLSDRKDHALLNQADFILTLMSVHWDAGRHQLEDFSRRSKIPDLGSASPFNPFIQPGADQLLRVAIAFGFRRGRMRDGYAILRGRDLKTSEYTSSARDKHFNRLREAQTKVLDLTNWHEFLKCLGRAGFRSGKMITSYTALLYSYALFLIGRCDHQVPLQRLRVLIARWFFMATVTSRYTGSYETQVDAELARLRDAKSPDDFCDVLERQIGEALTDDFWGIQLPAQLETSAARSPYLFAYYAALNLLGARILFSDLRISDLFDPFVRGNRAALERHHLFPRGYLASLGLTSSRDVNQVANFALVEWPDNMAISDQAPSEYAPKTFEKLNSGQRDEMLYWHALSEGWWNLDYADFLINRRRKMAEVIRAGYKRIGQVDVETTDIGAASISELITRGEGDQIEFKSTARWNLEESRQDERIEFAVAKTVAGFLNSGGGTLLIGVDDSGKPVGLSHDYLTLKKKDSDGFQLWVTDIFSRMLGKPAMSLIHVKVEPFEALDVARVTVRSSPVLVYLNPARGERVDEVYYRFGNSTRRLTPREVAELRDQGTWVGSSPPSNTELDSPDLDEKPPELEPV